MHVLIGFAALVFALEDRQLLSALAPGAPRDWRIVRDDFVRLPGPLRRALDLLFGTRRALDALVKVRMLAAASLIVYPTSAAAALLAFGAWTWAVRWRGTFNGGSDAMTMIVLIGVAIERLRPGDPRFAAAAAAYVVAHLVVGYVTAGLVKLRNAEWRNGRALAQFLADAGQGRPPAPLALALAWLTIAFELLFPLTLVNTTSAAILLSLGLVFHLANAYVFGLNRFFLAWVAAYPAVGSAFLFLATAR